MSKLIHMPIDILIRQFMEFIITIASLPVFIGIAIAILVQFHVKLIH